PAYDIPGPGYTYAGEDISRRSNYVPVRPIHLHPDRPIPDGFAPAGARLRYRGLNRSELYLPGRALRQPVIHLAVPGQSFLAQPGFPDRGLPGPPTFVPLPMPVMFVGFRGLDQAFPESEKL